MVMKTSDSGKAMLEVARKESKIASIHRRYKTATNLANSILQGWAFTGQSKEDHQRDVDEMVAIIKKSPLPWR